MPRYVSPDEILADARKKRALAYLENARRCADLVNAVEMPRIGENTDPARVRDVAMMNALMALAESMAPEPPGTRY